MRDSISSRCHYIPIIEVSFFQGVPLLIIEVSFFQGVTTIIIEVSLSVRCPIFRVS